MTMNYEQKYKEALENFKIIKNANKDNKELVYFIECEYPELRESEDKRIRKEIINFLELPHPQFVGKRDHEKWIAWLEKQGENKSSWSEEDEYQFNTILHGLDLKRELYKKEGNQVEEKRYKTQYDWLKSIKPNHWKPSKEQMEAIKFCCANFEEYDALQSLYNDLKSL